MTDRELLERAAKAAGIWAVFIPTEQLASWMKEETPSGRFIVDGRYWNPLTDDGDALRLAVKLNILWKDSVCFIRHLDLDEQANDPSAATRRAIVRAAASIGETL